jgi:hypothetical protein
LASLGSRPKILTPKSPTGLWGEQQRHKRLFGHRSRLRQGTLPAWLEVRAVGALGRYDYRGTLFGADADLGTTFDGDASYGAALLGYRFRARTLTAKLFAGVEAEDQRISPRDPANSVQGNAVGLKLAAESWLDLSPLWFLSVDASYGTAFQEYWSLARAGYRLGPLFSLGIEGGALGNEEYDAGRGGAFVKASLRSLEVTL